MTPERGSRRLPLVAVGTALVLVVAGAALALALSGSGGGHEDTGTAAGIGVLPTAPASAPRPSTTSPTRTRASTAGWPLGLSAWTVVIASIAKHRHPRAAAEHIARAASSPGLPAEVLDSSQHPRLRPALWIVFVGRYASRAQALRAATRVQAAGRQGAVVERLTG